MLILTSNGLSSDNLMKEMSKYCASLSKAVLITTASVGYKEKDWHIPRLTKELMSFSLTVDYFDFDVQSPELLLQHDLIEIIGGNPFYLLKSMRKANCEGVMKKLIQDKIVIGISAGSVVMQKNINLIAQYSPELNEGIDLIDFSGFGFTDIELLPHYSKYMTRFDRFEERAREYEIANDCNVIRINDGQAVIVTNDNYLVIS